MAPKAKAPAAAAPAAGKAKAKPKAKGKSKAEKEEEEPKMQPPDAEEFEAAMTKIQETIDEYSTQQQELAKKISERSGGKDEYFAKRKEYKDQLDQFQFKLNDLSARKEEINKAMGENRKEGVDMRNQLNKMKKSIGYTSEKDIDDRIATIEFKLWTDTITLKEEKDYLKEIQELKRNRPKVNQVNKMEDSLSTRDTGSNLRESISSINEEMQFYRDGKKQVSAKLTELNEGRKEQLGDLPNYIADREKISGLIKEQMALRTAKRDEFRQKEREFNQWKAEMRRAKQDKMMEERQARDAQWQMQQRLRKAEEMDVQPHVSEMTLIEQTISFCKSLIQDKGPTQQEEKKEVAHNNPEGTEVLLKKEDRDEYYYAPTVKKTQKKKGKKEGGSKPIKHNASTFMLFDKLKLDAPITTDDIPGTLEKLEEQLESYKEKVKAWEKNRDELKQKIMAGEAIEEEKAEEEQEGEQEEDKEDKDDEKEKDEGEEKEEE
jgi:uncharacterized coiled-coil DUF342 family protein